MKSHTFWKISTLIALLVFALALSAGCAKKRAPESVMDTPEHHTNNGMKSFEKGELDEAQREAGFSGISFADIHQAVSQVSRERDLLQEVEQSDAAAQEQSRNSL